MPKSCRRLITARLMRGLAVGSWKLAGTKKQIHGRHLISLPEAGKGRRLVEWIDDQVYDCHQDDMTSSRSPSFYFFCPSAQDSGTSVVATPAMPFCVVIRGTRSALIQGPLRTPFGGGATSLVNGAASGKHLQGSARDLFYSCRFVAASLVWTLLGLGCQTSCLKPPPPFRLFVSSSILHFADLASLRRGSSTFSISSPYSSTCGQHLDSSHI
jgi:hypothetical protein